MFASFSFEILNVNLDGTTIVSMVEDTSQEQREETWCSRQECFGKEEIYTSSNRSKDLGSNMNIDVVCLVLGATWHFCQDLCWFKVFRPIEDGPF